jgi:LysR family transcriptional activator of nhaA
VVRHNPSGRPLQFRIGIADAVPKSIAYLLLEPSVRLPEQLRIICREANLTDLLADLAIRRLDIVIADSPMPANVDVRCYNHLLGECSITFFGKPALARRYKEGFPESMAGAPYLLQGEQAAVRPRLMRWFEKRQIRPRIVGEFDDGALLQAFGEAGTGIFAAPSVIASQVCKQYGVVAIGSTDEVTERFYAISVEHRLTHPAVVAIRSSARQELFSRKVGGKARA